MMKTIKTKMIFGSVAIIIIVLLVLNTTNYFIVSDQAKKTTITTAQNTSKMLATDINRFISGVYSLVEQLSFDSQMNTFVTDLQKPILVKSVEKNPYFDLLYVQGTDGMQTARSKGENGDRKERFWFKQMMQTKQSFVSKSYYSLSGNTAVTSIYFPMFDSSNNMTGIFGSDIKLDSLQQLVVDVSKNEGTYAFIVDGEGSVLAHNDPAQVKEIYNYLTLKKAKLDAEGKQEKDSNGKEVFIDIDFEEVTKENLVKLTTDLLSGNSGVMEFKDSSGKDSIFAYTPIKLPGDSKSWGVVVVTDKQTYLSVIYKSVVSNLFLSLILLVLTTVLIYFFAGKIAGNIRKLVDQTILFAKGDFSKKIQIESKDELGTLAKSFNEMSDSIVLLLKQITETTENVSGLSGGLTESVRQTSLASEQIAVSIEQISAKSKDGLDYAQSVGNETKAITTGVFDITQNIANTSSSVFESQEKATKGLDGSEKAINCMNDIQKAFSETSKQIEGLSSVSGEIGLIIDAIKNISNQTNLLALNAAIEAARAGEHGRGFAVVADEVRKLASQSTESADKIESLIKNIQDYISLVVKSNENGSMTVKIGSEVVEQQKIQFNAINQSISKVVDGAREIETSVRNIRESVENLNMVSTQMIQVAEVTSNEAQNIAAAAEEQSATMTEVAETISSVSEMSDLLKNQVNRFKL